MSNLYSYYTQVIFLVFIVVNHMTEVYLSRRQLQTLQKNYAKVPDEFAHSLSIEDHQKAVHYSTAKLYFSQFHLVWDAALMFFWFPFRGAEKLYVAIPDWGMHREVIFLLSFSLIQMIFNLPWSLYSTFVLEQKFGFNNTTWKLFFTDRLKVLAIGGLIGVPLIYGLVALYEKLGTYWWLFGFIFLTIFQFALVWIYPTYIAPLFNKFKPLEEEELKTGIEKLVSNAGFKAHGVFVMDASKRSSHGNAYFTGFGKAKRVVFFDTLLKDLKITEVLAILAHELGHLKLKHIPKSLIASLVISFLGFFLMGVLSKTSWFYTGHFIRVSSAGVLFLLFSTAIPLYTFWTTPISSWISRRREFEADAYAASETDAKDLISGLLKLYQQNASPVVTDKIYSGFYHSHPPALERIKKLESLERKPS